MPPTVDDTWSGLEPAEVAGLLTPVPVDWWICGGWAIDLWLGRKTRKHANFDVGYWAADLRRVLAALVGWDAYLAKDGRLHELSGDRPPDGGSVWLRRQEHTAWDIQLMPEAAKGNAWLFRRNQRLKLPMKQITFRTEAGFNVLRPEIQLLYKAKDVRPRDESDFDAVLPDLVPVAKAWLLNALQIAHPGHPWIDRLVDFADT